MKFATFSRLCRGCVGDGPLSDVILESACFPCQRTSYGVTAFKLADKVHTIGQNVADERSLLDRLVHHEAHAQVFWLQLMPEAELNLDAL